MRKRIFGMRSRWRWDERSRAEAARALAWAAGLDPNAQRELIPLLEDAAEAARGEDRELALALEVRRLAALTLLPGHSPRFEDETERFRDLAGDTPAERALSCFDTRSCCRRERRPAS